MRVHMPLRGLYAKWEQLAEVAVAADDTIQDAFLHFKAGTDRHDVWRWFEAQNPSFVLGDVMQGIRHPVGCSGVFQSRYGQYANRSGQAVEVLEPVDPTTYDSQDVGPMYWVSFPDGVVLEAWPEELESLSMKGGQDETVGRAG